MMQERQRFVSRSSHPKVLCLRWGRIQEMTLKNPLTPLPRARSPLKPKVTYYGFHGEEWSLQTSWVAHNRSWAITSTPSHLGAQGSKSNKHEIRVLDQNQVLKRWEWGSLALVLDQNLWTKSLLIVRRSYTQNSNIKTIFLSMLEHRLFIPFPRCHASTIELPVQPHHLHTCSITQLNIHVFCHISPKLT